jgi:hypothetical protein
MVTSFIFILDLTSKKRRGLFIGLLNVGVTTGISCGALLAGLLTPVFGWVCHPSFDHWKEYRANPRTVAPDLLGSSTCFFDSGVDLVPRSSQPQEYFHESAGQFSLAKTSQSRLCGCFDSSKTTKV